MDFSRTHALLLAILAGLVATFAFSAVVADRAAAQGPGSEFCEEYPEVPGCEEGPGGGGGDDEEPADDEGENPTAAGAGPTGDAGDELPFTGYPLTALLLLLLILLLVGLAIRTYLAIRDRVTHDHTAGP